MSTWATVVLTLGAAMITLRCVGLAVSDRLNKFDPQEAEKLARTQHRRAHPLTQIVLDLVRDRDVT